MFQENFEIWHSEKLQNALILLLTTKNVEIPLINKNFLKKSRDFINKIFLTTSLINLRNKVISNMYKTRPENDYIWLEIEQSLENGQNTCNWTQLNQYLQELT